MPKKETTFIKEQKAMPEFAEWKIEDVKPYKKNAKIHTEKQIENLAAMIEQFGFRQPIVVDESGIILAGHGRRKAAIRLKLKTVPVCVVRDLSEKEKAAYRIGDNMVARGSYDQDLLGKEIVDILGFTEHDLMLLDTNLLGMNDKEITDIFEKFGDASSFGPSFYDIQFKEPTFDETKMSTNKEPEFKPSYSIVIECEDEMEQQQIYEQMIAEGKKCKVQTIG